MGISLVQIHSIYRGSRRRRMGCRKILQMECACSGAWPASNLALYHTPLRSPLFHSPCPSQPAHTKLFQYSLFCFWVSPLPHLGSSVPLPFLHLRKLLGCPRLDATCVQVHKEPHYVNIFAFSKQDDRKQVSHFQTKTMSPIFRLMLHVCGVW